MDPDIRTFRNVAHRIDATTRAADDPVANSFLFCQQVNPRQNSPKVAADL
jgi:hypothetical protein